MIRREDINWASIEIDGINMSDYPDFCDAYACYAETVDGRALTDEELDYLNDNYRDDLADDIQEAGIDAQADAADWAYDAYRDGLYD